MTSPGNTSEIEWRHVPREWRDMVLRELRGHLHEGVPLKSGAYCVLPTSSEDMHARICGTNPEPKLPLQCTHKHTPIYKTNGSTDFLHSARWDSVCSTDICKQIVRHPDDYNLTISLPPVKVLTFNMRDRPVCKANVPYSNLNFH